MSVQGHSEYARTLSIIVPVLNERENVQQLLEHLASSGAEQLVIVDGGSVDGTFDWLNDHWSSADEGQILIQSMPGRARQMNAGARAANGDLLMFLHADSRLPKGAKREVINARENQHLWGRFDIAFASTSEINWQMKIIALFMNIRSRLSSIATGDQAIFVDAILFRSIGSYPDIPLMEDIAITTSLKRHSVPHCSPLKVMTSARRWEKSGVVKTVLLMWYLRLAYFCRADPRRLAKLYRELR